MIFFLSHLIQRTIKIRTSKSLFPILKKTAIDSYKIISFTNIRFEDSQKSKDKSKFNDATHADSQIDHVFSSYSIKIVRAFMYSRNVHLRDGMSRRRRSFLRLSSSNSD